MTHTFTTKPSIGALCLCNDALLWDKFGYWHGPLSDEPEWFAATLADAKAAALIAQPSNIKWKIDEGKNTDGKFHCTYTIYDESNPWLEQWTCGLETATEQRAKAYVAEHAEDMARLTGGSVEALIDYRETGIPKHPRWVPDSQLKIMDKQGNVIGHYPRVGDAKA